MKFGNAITLFGREFHIFFEFHLNVKKSSQEERKNVSSNTGVWNFSFHHDVFVGGVVGWLAKDHVYQTQPVYTHPEMFDENGNILPDEILAVRFENDYELDEDEE